MKFNNKIDLESEEQLLLRCQNIEGLSIGQLAHKLKIRIPINPLQRKGFIGSAVELALGTTAKNKASPDFCSLGIELKTLPINHLGKPAESTFVTSIPLLTIQQETWESSQCFSKLKRVLWLTVEGDKSIEFSHRRIGKAILWSPSIIDEEILKKDWTEFVLMISTGKLAEISASLGEYLQIRPKAANGKSLCYGYDETGSKVLTMPRGFYLRASFTGKLLS